MKIQSCFPSKYIKAADLADGAIDVVIESVELETMVQGDDDDKPVVRFRGHKQGLVLNVTNSGTIAEAYGPETDDWGGKAITLYATKTQFGGKMVDCVRIKIPNADAAALKKEADETFGG